MSLYDHNIVQGGITYHALFIYGLEVRIAQFDANTCGHLTFSAELEGKFHNHPGENLFQHGNVYCIGLKGFFLTDRLTVPVRDNRGVIDPMRPLRELDSTLSKCVLQVVLRYLSEVAN